MKERNDPIIINGEKLGPIKTLLFERKTRQIRAALAWLSVIVGGLLFVKELDFIANKQAAESVVLAFVIIIYTTGVEGFMSKVVFINNGAAIRDDDRAIAKALRNSWIINAEMVEEMLNASLYKDGDQKVEILKNSSGHRVIDGLKAKAAYDAHELVPTIKNPEMYLVSAVMRKYNSTGDITKMHKDFRFSDKSLKNLQGLYTTANGMVIDNEFSEKALDLIPKEKILKFLEDRFETKEVSDIEYSK